MILPTPTITPPPGILPEHLHGAAPAEYHVEIPRSVRALLRRRAPVRVSEWAEKHRVLVKSSIPGPWHNSVTPHLVGIMDAAAFPSVRKLALCKGPQGGGSEAAHNFVGYLVDRAPGDVLYVYPDEDTANVNAHDRIIPMLRSSARLRSYLTGQADDEGAKRINLKHCTLYLAWARSATKLANKPAPYVILDEIDKYPPTASKTETDPISLAEARTTTFPHKKKIILISTPTIEGGNIWRALSEADAVYDYHARCPACSELHVMHFGGKNEPGGIKWPADERDPKRIRSGLLAWYECPACSARWDDYTRDRAVAGGMWLERSSGMELFAHLTRHRPHNIGFHMPKWLSTFVSISEVAAAFLEAHTDESPTRVKKKRFANEYEARPWKEDLGKLLEWERLQAIHIADDYGPAVPDEALVITCGADVQIDRIEAEVVAWAPGLGSWSMGYEMFQGDPALTDVWDQFDRFLLEPWPHASGISLPIAAVCVDSGYKTKQVNEFCRGKAWRKVWPTKGANTHDAPAFEARRSRSTGVTYFRLGTNTLKDTIFSHLELAGPSPGFWHFPPHYPDRFYQMMTAESRRLKFQKGQAIYVYERIAENRPNEALDCRVNALAALAILNPNWEALKNNHAARVEKHRETTPDAAARKQVPQHRRKKGWVKGWQ